MPAFQALVAYGDCLINVLLVNGAPVFSSNFSNDINMKKLLILALVGGIAISASAQRTYDRHPVPRKDYPRNHHVNKRESLERRIDLINRDYDTQIRYVKNNPRLRNKEKKRQIRQL